MQASRQNLKCDVAIVGGGLSGGLIALALAKTRPDLKVILIEAEEHFGGNHIWSFFASDIAPQNRWLTAPLVTYGWSGHDVHFPDHSRELDGIYYTIESERLDWVLRHSLPAECLMTGREVKAVSPRLVVLDGAQRINAGGVIDARGVADINHLVCGMRVAEIYRATDAAFRTTHTHAPGHHGRHSRPDRWLPLCLCPAFWYGQTVYRGYLLQR
jgi:lycopene beta-cyclase